MRSDNRRNRGSPDIVRSETEGTRYGKLTLDRTDAPVIGCGLSELMILRPSVEELRMTGYFFTLSEANGLSHPVEGLPQLSTRISGT